MTPFESSKTRASVRWESSCTINYFPTPSPEDVSRAWFKDDEYKAFRQQCKILARLANEIGTDALETYCNDTYRGLEFTLEGDKRETRNSRRELAWEIVLDDGYDSCDESGEHNQSDWKKTVLMYQVLSRDAMKDARLIALQDVLSEERSYSFQDGDVRSFEASSLHLAEPAPLCTGRNSSFPSSAVKPSPLICVLQEEEGKIRQ